MKISAKIAGVKDKTFEREDGSVGDSVVVFFNSVTSDGETDFEQVQFRAYDKKTIKMCREMVAGELYTIAIAVNKGTIVAVD